MNFKILLMAVLALFFATGCVSVKAYNYALGEEQKYGFRVSKGESEKVKNPSGNLVRVYFYSNKGRQRIPVYYSIGKFDRKNVDHSPKQMVYYISKGEYAYKDLEVKEGEALNFFISFFGSSITFYPKATQIYCISFADFSILLVDKQKCLEDMKDVQIFKKP